MGINQLIRKGEELLISGNFEDAAEVLTEVLIKEPHNPEAYYLLGDTLCKLRHFEDAITLLRKANRLLPHNPQIIHLLGWSLFMNNEIEAGRLLLESVLKIDPTNQQLFADLTVLEMKEGNIGKAREYCDQAIMIFPDDPMIQKLNSILLQMKHIQKMSHPVN